MPPANHHPLEDPNALLAERLRARIRRDGSMSFRDWMKAALYDEREGYYRRSDRERWGRTGDYRTSPEQSPLFAVVFARYFAKLYGELGRPATWTLIESGAGSGEFALGVLTRLQARHPEVFASMLYLVDEISSESRARIEQKLSGFSRQFRLMRIDEIRNPVDLGVVFSNELLDSFPVYRVIMVDGKPRELCVGLDETDRFAWVARDLTNDRLSEYLGRTGQELSEGQIIEVNLDAQDWIERVARTLRRGFVISVDYGATRVDLRDAPHRREGTLRAFYRHQIVDDVLARPGEQDLTTTVDWTQITEAGGDAGLEVVRFARLDQFLLQEGLLDELTALTGETNEVDATRLRTSAREMVMPDGMASSFQVLVQRIRQSAP